MTYFGNVKNNVFTFKISFILSQSFKTSEGKFNLYDM